MVVHIHTVFIGMKNRLGYARDLGLIIRHPFYSDHRALGQDSRAVPDVEYEDTTGNQVMPSRFKCRRHIFVGYLVADGMKEGDHCVETIFYTDFTYISQGEGQLGMLSVNMFS